MARKDYIDKINKNMEKLTKDELKDVATLTNAQFGVRLKVAEKEYWEKEIADLKSQLQQQALPVVPECVGIWIKKCQELNWMITDVLAPESWSSDFAKDTENWLKKSKENFNLLALAFITGKYQVEKPQLFYIELPNVYGLSDSVLVSKVENGTILEFTKGKDYALAFTEQEIKSIDERYWQFAVPVEDGE